VARIAALTGFSGAGKTTLIVRLIERYVAEGHRVAAIKHTHHKLNDQRRGDTERFVQAGADPVVFADPTRAVIFRRGAEPEWRDYTSPQDLVPESDIVLVEGFKQHGPWPQVLIDEQNRPTVDELAAILDRIWRQ
jgi:molybdopterin-guanine dinucleotide biosynthesis protein MobB